VRGICCLRPGVQGLSETIRVRSVVGRFLEHSRCYYFENNEAPEALIGSADIMRRNLDRRVEVLVPITDKSHVDWLRVNALEPYLKDNTNSWILSEDGVYRRPEKSGKAFSVQEALISMPLTKGL